jgi:hypothetical protein
VSATLEATHPYRRLVGQLCDCTSIDRTLEGQPCRVCGKRIITREDERVLRSMLVFKYTAQR